MGVANKGYVIPYDELLPLTYPENPALTFPCLERILKVGDL